MWFGRMQLFPGGSIGAEHLDQPPSNFDVAGIPRDAWSSSFFACLSNIVPSCLFAFCIPCVLWGQVVIRAQIPLLIALKNSFSCLRRTSGYSCFLNTYLSLIVAMAISFGIAYFLSRTAPTVSSFFYFVFAIIMVSFMYINGHTRTAIKLKYAIPPTLRGCLFWDCLLDAFVSTVCFPCSLSQMARHVFQYDRWNPRIGFFISDPTSLDALESCPIRPPEADTAGLFWANDEAAPVRQNTGRAEREREQQRHRDALASGSNGGMPSGGAAGAVAGTPNIPPHPSAPSYDSSNHASENEKGMATAVAYATPVQSVTQVYRADGTPV